MMIQINTVPHGKQRYDTVGDWFYEGGEPDGILHIRVSDLGDWRMEAALILHELVEAFLCRQQGITQHDVDEFDFASDREEPGDDLRAPYFHEHRAATEIELVLLGWMGISREEYAERCQNPASTSLVNKATEPVSPSD